MDIAITPGNYVLAVSGGVDSIVLLHIMQQLPELQLTVAHYDHGIRDDSMKDRRFVQELTSAYKLPFVYQEGRLGASASEARARKARYEFLQDVRRASNAKAIITAHHQDDVLETIILNLLRGTGSRGLNSLKSTETVMRPLIDISKDTLIGYAQAHNLRWNEDSTNADEIYLRNYIRKHILPRFSVDNRDTMLKIRQRAASLNEEITIAVVNYLHVQPSVRSLNRHSFIMLPHATAREVIAQWLLVNTTTELSRRRLERLVIAAKTGRIGSSVDIDTDHWLDIGRADLALRVRER
jgi:tRNA(Ile)-lysidine synthetase-like protein